MIARTLIAVLLFAPYLANGQKSGIKGRVLEEGRAMELANVALSGTPYGAVSGPDGNFHLDGIPPGEYELSVSVLGFRTERRKVVVEGPETLELGEIRLQPDILGLEEVVVTGTMKETYIKDSPVKVSVITSGFLDKHLAPTNLVEGVSLVGGLQEVVACGVCYTNSISINGLPGPNTAVLIDGAPMYGNLASVYGLNGIPQSIIERYEVIKGPNSTLYGSEAVAGVINIITKKPERQPLLTLDVRGGSGAESFGSLTYAPLLKHWRGYVGLDYGYSNSFQDRNGDQFGDYVNMDRISLFSKWSMDRPEGRQFTLFGKYYYEDRRNGVRDFLADRSYRQLRGSGSIYGESIYTQRAELFGNYDLPFGSGIGIDYSFSLHDQDSYYGADRYWAKQAIAFGNLKWVHTAGRHDLLLGITTRWQYYDDNTIATEVVRSGRSRNLPDRQFIPGIFLQDEWEISKDLELLAGARLDHYQAHGLIFSPRLNARYKPSEWSTLRLNLGTGFRIVNLFTEDHAFISGQRQVVIDEDLQPERSYSASLNFNHIFTLGKSQGNLDVDAHYTYFTNKIIPDYGTPGMIIYGNSGGHALTRGMGLTWQQQFAFPLALNFNVGYQKVTQTEPGETGKPHTTPIAFAPSWSGLATLNYTLKRPKLTFAYTFNWTGPMALPEVFDLDAEGLPLPEPRPLTSPDFFLHHLQLTYEIQRFHLELYGGVKNLFDYRQSYSPLAGFNDPDAETGFSEYFDTAYAYGPVRGRQFYLGFRWELGAHR